MSGSYPVATCIDLRPSVPISLHSTMSAVKRDFEDFHGEMYESSYFLETEPIAPEIRKTEKERQNKRKVAGKSGIKMGKQVKRNHEGKTPSEEFEEFYRNMYEA
ncbi:unnamed protein product [Caenorhabditis auriculariae]|uniref:Uncharacterized protein n=1 Tax=Caenorhabditis auriculariae TaxID=2777116 RepID=A0A8S1HSD1_9PELO|nr:unnamed protein product [Caenorhabditis auriculariae]